MKEHPYLCFALMYPKYSSCTQPEFVIVRGPLNTPGNDGSADFHCCQAHKLVKIGGITTITLCFPLFQCTQTNLSACMTPSCTRLVGAHSTKLWAYVRNWATHLGGGGEGALFHKWVLFVAQWWVFATICYAYPLANFIRSGYLSPVLLIFNGGCLKTSNYCDGPDIFVSGKAEVHFLSRPKWKEVWIYLSML